MKKWKIAKNMSIILQCNKNFVYTINYRGPENWSWPIECRTIIQCFEWRLQFSTPTKKQLGKTSQQQQQQRRQQQQQQQQQLSFQWKVMKC